MFATGSSKDILNMKNNAKRTPKSRDKEDPLNILKNIVKGFDIAYPQDAHKGEDSAERIRGAPITAEEVKAWANPVHPGKNNTATLLDSYPILPDLEAIPQMGSYMIMKFYSNPVPMADKYDTRLDTAIFRPCVDPEKEVIYEQKKEEWAPESGKPKPLQEYDYDYYIPGDENAVPGIKRKLDIRDPDNKDPELYTDDLGDDRRAFKYPRLRTYETQAQTGDDENPYNDTVAIALHDPETEVGPVPGTTRRLAKGAYFYPISTRMVIKPKRKIGMPMITNEEEKPDELNLMIVDPDEDDIARIKEHQASLDSSIQVEGAAEE
jgi:RNA polymerase II-associated factor 1